MNCCPFCSAPADPRVLAKATDLLPPIVRRVAAEQGGWKPEDGICPTCALRHAQAFTAERSADSLHMGSEPAMTFPFYHAAEETVLAQHERLPDCAAFDGSGVTIAFLDSGYYPHPDLLAKPVWPGEQPVWETLDAAQLRRILSAQETRLVSYVDLYESGEAAGLHLDSLWDGSGTSWHGQMTTVVAAGNGLLSGGRYRGLAPGANLLPIRIGRSGGRIPEEDILAGLQWLLCDDNWERCGVRVVNVSVGGDYPQAWHDNPVCLAAEALSARGVLVAAAAGNSGQPTLLAPAQSPSVLTVGGYDDANRRLSPLDPESFIRLKLYSHSYGPAARPGLRKPELVALGRYVPSPILPVSPAFQELHAIARLRETLAGGASPHFDELVDHWRRTLYSQEERGAAGELAALRTPAAPPDQLLADIWQALRKRMNAHKWVHAHYQHVDGTSVAVAQVSAVAAQMFQANPGLSGERVKTLLMATALDLPHWPADCRGAGLLQPVQAVAAALRAPGGLLAGLPQSSTSLPASRLHKAIVQGQIARSDVFVLPGADKAEAIYFGLYAPTASSVSLIGAFNGWTPGLLPLGRIDGGWWQAAVYLPPGRHPHWFWVVDRAHPEGDWRPDPENPLRTESGYSALHSAVIVDL